VLSELADGESLSRAGGAADVAEDGIGVGEGENRGIDGELATELYGLRLDCGPLGLLSFLELPLLIGRAG